MARYVGNNFRIPRRENCSPFLSSLLTYYLVNGSKFIFSQFMKAIKKQQQRDYRLGLVDWRYCNNQKDAPH